jgi:hypothetical protein
MGAIIPNTYRKNGKNQKSKEQEARRKKRGEIKN